MAQKLGAGKQTNKFIFAGIFASVILAPVFIWLKEYMSIQTLLFPIVFMVLFYAFINLSKNYLFTYFDLAFLILLFGEIITTVFSSYPDNSLSSLTRFVVVFFLFIFYKILLSKVKERFWISALFFIFSSLLLFVTAGSFVSFYLKSRLPESASLYELKHLYHPLSLLKNGTLNNIWASSLLLFIPFNIVFLLKQKRHIGRLVVLLVLALNVFCIFVSFSRGIYISLFVFVVLLNVFAIRYFPFKKIILYNSIALLLLLPSAVLVKDSFVTTISFQKTISQKRSSEGRKLLWEHAIKKLTDKPVFGYGQRNFKLANENNPLVKEDIVFPNRTNNTYFQILVERGIFGLLYYALFFLLVSLLVFKNLKRFKKDKEKLLEIVVIYAGIIAFLTREFTFSSMLDNDFVYFLSFYLVISLTPYDIVLKELNLSSKRAKSILLTSFLLIVFLVFLNGKRTIMVFYNNQSVDNYYQENLSESNKYMDKALPFSGNDRLLQKHKAMILSKNSFHIEISKNYNKLISFEGSDKDSLALSLNHFLTALKKVPNDDEILHNVAWLHFALDEIEEAKKYVNRSIDLNPFNSTYQVSSVLMLLQNSELDECGKNLGKALRYSPSLLESRFYKVFSSRYPVIAERAKQIAIKGLEDQIKDDNSLILKARLARLLMVDEPERAMEILQEVSSKLPNLNRPWVYMAYLENVRGNATKAETYFNKALFYNRHDALAMIYTGNYYRASGNDNKAVNYYKSALKQYKPKRMPASAHNAGIDKMDNIPTMNFLNDLVYNLKPEPNAAELFTYLAAYHQEDEELNLYYKNLSIKYMGQVYSGQELIR